MTAALDYFSTSRPTQLSASIDATTSTVTVLDGVTYPDPALTGKQYTLLLAYGSDREEVVTVTGKPTATSFVVMRGQDGTPATAKNSGDTVVHGVSARDFNRVNALDSSLDAAEADIDALQAADTTLASRITAVELALPGKVDDTGDTITGPLTLGGPLAMGGNKITGLADAAAPGDALNQGAADTRYVNVSGDTVTGKLVIDSTVRPGLMIQGPATATSPGLRPELRMRKTDGTTGMKEWLWYISGANNDVMPDGSALSLVATDDSGNPGSSPVFRFHRDGRIVLGADPTAALGAATKQYADGAGYVINLSGNVASNATGQTQLAYLSGAAGWGTGISRNGNGIKVTKAGWYVVSFNGGIASVGGGSVRMMGVWGAGFTLLGTNSIAAYGPDDSSTSGWGAPLSASGLVYLDVNDTAYVYARQDSGASRAATATLCVALSRAA